MSSVHLVELPELSGKPAPAGPPVLEGKLGLLQGVKLRLGTCLGHATLTVAELFALKDGSVIRLDRLVDEPVDVLLDGRVIARGRLMAVDDSFGICITEAPQAPRP